MDKQKQLSRTQILRNIPVDLRIEIIENEFRKDFTESEKANIAEILKPYFQKQSKQGQRNDIKKTVVKPAIPNKLKKDIPPETVNQKIAKVLGESDETVRKRNIVFKDIDQDTKKSLDSGEKSLNSVFQKTVAAINAKKTDSTTTSRKIQSYCN